MSTFAPAETLREKRPLLLAMEAIGWFHMAGKARTEFLRRYGGERLDYRYEKWHQQETPPFPWDDLLGWLKRLYSSEIPQSAWPGCFAELTEKHRKRDPGLLGLLQAGHGVVSGVEKNLPRATSEYLGQTIPHMWLSSPWGHPKRNLLADPPEILSPQGWRQLVAEIRRVLEGLRDLGTNQVQDVSLWRRWREEAIGPGSFIRRTFLSTLAETRLPNNDVTLWDQSYVAAALFKSAVAGAVLDKNFPWKDGKIKGKVRWRLLTVAIGADHYEARAVKIGDWTGAQGTLEEFFRRGAELIEVDLAVGSLLYRDSTAAVFSFPGERFDETTIPAGWLNGWEKWLQDQADAIARDLDLETPPHVRLSAPTRSLVPLVRERQAAQRTVAIPVHRSWDVDWSMPSESRGHVCPVCRVRLNGDLTAKGQPCRVCWDRRHHRRDDWLQGRLGYDTIWFEEVADGNDRLALLTFSLDLEPWLSGERVDSLRAQAIPEWARFNPTLRNQKNPIVPTGLLSSLENEIKQRFRDQSGNWQFPANDPLLSNLHEGFRHLQTSCPQQKGETAHADAERLWTKFFESVVEDRAAAPQWSVLTDEQRATWFAHQLFVKPPSPGRVYRFWREAVDFFEDLLREFHQIAARSDNPWRVRRLVIQPDPSTSEGWKDCTLYDGRWRGVPFSLVYVQTMGAFITASNLARALQPEEQASALKDEEIPLEEEALGRSQKLKIAEAREIGQSYSHLGVYHPAIPLELSPVRFRVVVPLEAASDCVDLAIAWWRERFARVWDRLPLRVGVVAFLRLVPYQAVMEAARNIQDALEAGEEVWRVEAVEQRSGLVALSLRRPDGQSTLPVVPARMPDGREDVFYPYVAVEDRDLRFPRDFRHPQDGRIFRHVADLRPGDGIWVAPARIVALFMESTGARFGELDVRDLEEWNQVRAIWDLLQRTAPSQTALQRLRSDLVRLEQAWRSPSGGMEAPEGLRRDTFRALLVHHLEVQGAALEALTEAAMNGLLPWAMDWRMTALKESLWRKTNYGEL